MASQTGCKSVLVVEDDELIRQSLKTFLADEGYAVYTAKEGAEALKKLDEIPHPCLILLDYYMPVMDGREFLEKIKKDARTLVAGIPVVLVSAALERNVEGKDHLAGFIKKPIDLELLLSVVKNHCGSVTE